MKQVAEDRPMGGHAFCEHVVRGQRDIPSVTQVRTDVIKAEPEGQRTRVAQHSLVFLEGDPADRIYQLIEGAVMLYKLLPDGRRQVVELIGPGDVFGLSSRLVYDASAETLTPTVVAVFERALVEKSPAFLHKLNRCIQAQVCAMHEHAVLLGRKSALERVASFLIRFVPDRGSLGCLGRPSGGDRALVRLSMTRQEIADYLGLTIETVSRAFSELRRRGIVTLDKQDEVKINDVCGICRLTGTH
jgi:CRP/FNR family transcriptional regulator